MYEVRENKMIVNGTEVPTFIRAVCADGFDMVAEVGTTGFSEEEKETFTFMRIYQSGDAEFAAHIHEMEDGAPQAVDLIFRGNEELATFTKLILFAAEVLTDQIAEVDER